MRHNKDNKRFSRNTGHLRCMMSNLTRDLLRHERLKTTTPKSKELRRSAEKMISLGKLGTLAARRRAMAFLHDKEIVTKLFADLAPRFKDRKGGYTRSIKANVRNGDCAPMTLIELVDRPEEKVDEKPAKAKKAAPKKAKAKAPAKKAAAPKKEAAKKAPAKKKAAPKKETAEKAAPKKRAAPKKESVKPVAKKDGSKPAPKKPVNKKK
ncbi:MAG: 50S ribosomal protein L17 [Proteobacteria bacterium]|nr:50S ribosomal protein L17 [Pseudomonadota bacterium]